MVDVLLCVCYFLLPIVFIQNFCDSKPALLNMNNNLSSAKWKKNGVCTLTKLKHMTNVCNSRPNRIFTIF